MDCFRRIANLALEQFYGISWVSFIIALIVEIALVHVIYTRAVKKENYNRKTEILWMLLASYAGLVAQVTYFSREEQSRIGIYVTLTDIVIRQTFNQIICNLLNILLFIPFGVLLEYLLCRSVRKRRGVLIFLICTLGSLLIETAQYISGRGFFELIDIITNALGGAIGYMLVQLRIFIQQYFLKNNGNERNEK